MSQQNVLARVEWNAPTAQALPGMQMEVWPYIGMRSLLSLLRNKKETKFPLMTRSPEKFLPVPSPRETLFRQNFRYY